MNCEICDSQKSVFPNHYEEHIDPPKKINICRSCHTGIHTKHTRKRSGPQPRNIRKLIKLGGSRCMSLPMKWVKNRELLTVEKLTHIYTIDPLDKALVIAPEEYVEEFTKCLGMWSWLTQRQKEVLVKLGRQYREATQRTLPQRDIKNILKFSPEIREYVIDEIKNEQEIGPEQEVRPIV